MAGIGVSIRESGELLQEERVREDWALKTYGT